MNKKKAKTLRRIARKMCMDLKKPLSDIYPTYKKLKSTYKSSKGQL